ncbi:MAG: tRNA preQ1(34) S-adenosylmethionine ribosyltransferase-isomerase QueA [Candidatus Pacebacteria bacterium]|nr:tRNA preQ1(34) S-adenosylmethionine ribosyltransferase-isomerase QueA [Candidatus Paceibacterota bacterium]NUQ57361.1 tRNA preQ1(34) S-adenosylmethionine ribosyltransferase-isomerase QueA [Candidatus Paceibacter sp.]
MNDTDFQKILDAYDYQYPKELIAQSPASPRDSARLMIYNRKSDKVFFDIFANTTEYLPEKSLLVFNQTKVVPARLICRKETGGKIVLLYIGQNGDNLKFLSDRKIEISSKIFLTSKLFFTVAGQSEKFYFLRPSFPADEIFSVLQRYGKTPLPPYIKETLLKEKELREKYQAIFAKQTGSVAAPTASLHFTQSLLDKIKKSGHNIEFITLHVGLGTFAPLMEENIATGKLHQEYFEISESAADAINKAKEEGWPIIAVGSTVTRALEAKSDANGVLISGCGQTDIFIREGYKFKIVDGLITNFHVPRSSLLMLISAFAGRKNTLELYQKAIRQKFHLFSFGDGMMIL